MSAPNRDTTIESALPVVSSNGLNTNQNINFNSGSNSCDLPANTTLNGVAISAQGNISGSNTTGATFSVTNTGIYTGVGADQVIANSATTGVVSLLQANGLTTGTGQSITSTGILTTTGNLQTITANSATTSVGIRQVSGTSLTSGVADLITGGGASMTSAGVVQSIVMGAATTGSGQLIATTGVYTGTVGVRAVTANSATSGAIDVITATGLTSGIGSKVVAAAATLTTGFYYAANDGSLNVFTVGANGHLTSNQTTAPTIAVTTQNGITAAAITAGSTDVCGAITTTGTSTGSTVITVTFNKTYTTAPKVVQLTAANAAGGGVNSDPYISSITATTFVITVPPSGVYAATPSWYYTVFA